MDVAGYDVNLAPPPTQKIAPSIMQKFRTSAIGKENTMTGGYTGKILRINLTTKAVSTIDTAKYEEFGGGYGMGAPSSGIWRSLRANGI